MAASLWALARHLEHRDLGREFSRAGILTRRHIVHAAERGRHVSMRPEQHAVDRERPIVEHDRAAHIESMSCDDLPDGGEPTRDAFTQIDVAPDGHVWVQVTAPRGVSATLFDVFDPDGRYLGQLRAPADIYPGPVFHGDRMIGAVPDTLGVRYVVSWRIAR